VPLQVAPDREYPSGYSDTEVERAAAEDGNAAVHDPALWGENAQPRFLDVLNEGHATGRELIGHTFRSDTQQVVGRIETGVPQALSREQKALEAIDGQRSAERDELVLRYTIIRAGLPLPNPRAVWQLTASLLLLFVGDWAIVTVAFQVLGLSDRPWVPGVGFTDELHLAALTSVMLLVFLAHAAGDKLRRMAQAYERRRTAASAEARQALPRPSLFDALIFVVAVTTATLALWGLSAVRVAYLATQGIPSQAAPFLALQVGVLVAAVYLSYRHAHPHAEEWSQQRRATHRARIRTEECIGTLDEQVGQVNTDVDQLDTLLAQAGHHVRADAANARRQGPLYVRRALLAQPEPTTSTLFPRQLPAPAELEDTELARMLIGVGSLPQFTKLDTAKVTARREEVRRELRQLEDQLRQASVQPLLPAEDTPSEDRAGATVTELGMSGEGSADGEPTDGEATDGEAA